MLHIEIHTPTLDIWALLLAVALANGCQPNINTATMNHPMSCAAACTTDAELGIGDNRYMPLSDGDSTQLIRGPQGGVMLLLAVRAIGLNPAAVRLCYHGALLPADTAIADGCWTLDLDPADASAYERAGIWGALDARYWSAPEPLFDRAARFDVQLTDSCGCTAIDAKTVHIAPGVRF